MNVNKPPLLYEMKKNTTTLPTSLQNNDEKSRQIMWPQKQTKISNEPVSDREFLTWAALIRYEIEVQKFSWVDFHLDEKSPM